jgi:hypothetical protein
MNFAIFESMSQEEAAEHLAAFVGSERCALRAMEGAAAQAGAPLNYALASPPAVLKWFLSNVEAIRVPVPESEPPWVREFHKDGFVDFPEQSKYMILRAGYYLGECFVRAEARLSWGTGDRESVERNMPVVSGFRGGSEMAPVMVCENVFARILDRRGSESDIDRMVGAWRGLMPTP